MKDKIERDIRNVLTVAAFIILAAIPGVVIILIAGLLLTYPILIVMGLTAATVIAWRRWFCNDN